MDILESKLHDAACTLAGPVFFFVSSCSCHLFAFRTPIYFSVGLSCLMSSELVLVRLLAKYHYNFHWPPGGDVNSGCELSVGQLPFSGLPGELEARGVSNSNSNYSVLLILHMPGIYHMVRHLVVRVQNSATRKRNSSARKYGGRLLGLRVYSRGSRRLPGSWYWYVGRKQRAERRSRRQKAPSLS